VTSTYTVLGFNLQGPGDNINVWGDILNEEVFTLADEAIRGMASFAVSGTVTLTSTNGESNQARCAILNITGGTGGTVIVPNFSKTYVVRNGATGNVIISTGGATNATVEPGDLTVVFSDGSSVRQLMIAGYSIRDYIAAATLSSVELPAQVGNAGKFLKTDGTNATWQAPASTDLSDYATRILGVQVALAVAL
jgi:hypothetical protein